MKRLFPKIMSSMAMPRPNVTIARLMPRARTAGSANRAPRGIVATTPASSAGRNGQPAVVDQAARDERPEPGQSELAEGQLSGVPGDHDDREQYETHREGGDEGVLPAWRYRHDEERCGHESGRHDARTYPAAADCRQALEEVVPQRQRLAAHDHPSDDHGERKRV